MRTLKKPAARKRTNLPRRVDFAGSFLKDWRRLSRFGRYDRTRLKKVMLLLATNDGPLGAEWRDHALKGNWSNHRECHVGGDFLPIYRLDESDGPSGMVVFVRMGTYSELFQ